MIVGHRSANRLGSKTSLLCPNPYISRVHSVPSIQATATPTLPRSSRDPLVQMHLISVPWLTMESIMIFCVIQLRQEL
jgi:hypothetical protein